MVMGHKFSTVYGEDFQLQYIPEAGAEEGRGGPRAFVVSPLWCVFKNSLNKTDFGKDVTGSTLSFVRVDAKMS